jgi:3'-phosphoadenosine 5'-phosphosulfate sulfotransferase (PAPS reductase)/FAD synthetase
MTDFDRLAMSPEAVARLTRPERERRVADLTAEAHALLDEGRKVFITSDDKAAAGIVVLFSGGNDSTVLAHLFRDRATHAAHANTGVGIEQTREYVRATCQRWGLPLLERKAPREEDSYRAHVLAYGFPGPGAHYKMFQRLKERALEQVRRELVQHSYRERVIFLAGRRRTESDRRSSVPEMERRGSTVWISPLVNWTKPDLNTYRLLHGDVPVNIVSDLIHMSGECLCGAFAHHGERAEISEWYPGAFDEIAELEALIADRDDIPEYRRRWGWAGDPRLLAMSREKPTSGLLCQSCDVRWEQSALSLDEGDAA